MNDSARPRLAGSRNDYNRQSSFDGIVRRPVVATPRSAPVKIMSQPLAVDKKPAEAKPTKRVKLATGLLNTGFVLFLLIGFLVFYDTWQTNNDVREQTVSAVSDDASDVSDEKPSEVRPEVAGYKVAADLPRMLRIDSIKVDARVVRLGVKSNNQLKAPANIFDAGWYEGSAKPGEAGAVVIDGHVRGPTQPGVFSRLKELQPGQTIQIEKGNGSVVNYKVIKTQQYDSDKVDMAAAITPVEAGKNGLNIITCEGRYDKKTNQYQKRLVVFASQQ